MRETNFRNTNVQYTTLQKIDDNNIIRSNKKKLIQYGTTQTKKKSLFVGGGNPFKVRSGKSKKWKVNPMRYAVKNPLIKSTKSWYNPKRYLASTQTKKKREARRQRRDESHVEKKLYYYQRLKDSVTAYQTAKDELKQAKDNRLSKEVITDLKTKKANAKALMYKVGNVQTHMSSKDILKIANSSIAKYEEKQKYYVESTDKLKSDSIDFIKNRIEYLKNGKPELTKKLDSLATNDHTKMAFIKISGIGLVPVNKLKYSDFNTDNPRVINAYLDQFKTVNDSITKINKDFNINNLSPDRKVELTKELHKITVDSIYDPAAQEAHFLKAVTDIAYKDKYYKALSQDGKRDNVLKSYMEKQGPYAQPVDTLKPNLRQKKFMLEQKLRKAELSDPEKRNIRTEIEYLDKELKQSPETIDKQIHEQEKLMTGISKLDPKYNELRMNLDRLKEHRANIETVKKADFTADITIIANEITKLKEARDLLLKTSKINTSIDSNTLSDELSKINAELGSNPSEERHIVLEKHKNRLESVIKKQDEFKQIQDTITTLESMTPDAREKFKDDLQFLSGDELRALLAEKQKIKLLGTSDQLQDVIQKDISQIETAIKVQGFKNQINQTNILDVMKERIKQGITADMEQNNLSALKDKILNDKELIFRLAKQLADKKAANAAQNRANTKEKLVDAKTKHRASLNKVWKRVGAKFIRAPENIQVLRRQLNANTNYSAKVAKQAAKISKAVKDGKITPKKATQLLTQFDDKHVGYIPEDVLELLRVVANNSQPTKTPTRSGAIRRNPVGSTVETDSKIVNPVAYSLASRESNYGPVKYTNLVRTGEEIYENLEKNSPYNNPPQPWRVNPLTGKPANTKGFSPPSANTLQHARAVLKPVSPTQ